MFERYQFFSRAQSSGDAIELFVTDLKKKSLTCEFSDLRESLIRDRIVCGVTSQQLKERMLREVDLTLEKALALARADEETKKQMKQMNAATSAESVDNLHNKSKASISNRKSQKTGRNCHTRGITLQYLKARDITVIILSKPNIHLNKIQLILIGAKR